MNTPTKGQLWAARDEFMVASSWLRAANRTRIHQGKALGYYNKCRARFERIADAIREGRAVRYPMQYSVDFHARVKGIPCGVHIESYTPFLHGGWSHPDQEEGCEVIITDRRGYPWPDSMLKGVNWPDVENQALRHLQAEELDAKLSDMGL